jgi:DNA-binding MurR/RpiR family transcriptional regulator
MNNDILLNISTIMESLTKAERKVADFVLQFPHDVLYMSITDLAEHCGVGDTTVFRFCKTLKINGYQDFKMMLAQSLSSKETIGAMTLSDEINITDSTDEVCQKLLNTNITALKQTLDMIRFQDIETAVNMIANAKLIYFFVAGASSVMALEAYYKFARILPNVISTQDIHMQAMASSLLSETDLAIAFSYSGSTKDVIDILKRAKQNHAKTICITRFAESPLTAYADIVLLCGANEGSFQGGALSAKVAQLYLLDILYTEYFKKNYIVSDQNKKLTTQSIASKLL